MRVYIALGSNLGNRQEYLRAGLRGLADGHVDIIHTASVYSTEPRDVLDQPWFLNTAIEADTELRPEQLLAACLDVEQQNERVRNPASNTRSASPIGRSINTRSASPIGRSINKGPRTLDIDIIFYGTEIIRTPELTIPHPRFTTRRFVLVPLAEIAPTFIDPLSGKTVAELLEQCPDEGEVHLAGAL